MTFGWKYQYFENYGFGLVPVLGEPLLAGGVVIVDCVRMGVGLAGVRRNGSLNARINEITSNNRPPIKEKSPKTAQPPVADPVSCTELELVGNAPVTLIVPCQEMMREITPRYTRTVASVNSHWDFITYLRGCLCYRRL